MHEMCPREHDDVAWALVDHLRGYGGVVRHLEQDSDGQRSEITSYLVQYYSDPCC